MPLLKEMDKKDKPIPPQGNYKLDSMIEIFLDTTGGKSTGQAIMDQEKREQVRMIAIQTLPKQGDSFFKLSISECYKKLGIEIIEAYDDLFYKVELPPEWKIKPLEHSMWSNLVDDKGRKRAIIFYKGAFYDRSASISFCCRYTHEIIPEDEYQLDTSFEKRANGKYFGVVYDAEQEIFRTKEMHVKTKLIRDDRNRERIKRHYSEKEKIERILREQCINFLKERFPNCEDIFAYWDD